MPSAVSVGSAAIQGGIGCCKTSIQVLESTSKALMRSYQQAGAGGWKDQKYAELGAIVDECYSALSKPIQELSTCISKLEVLLSAVQDYEQTRI